MHSGVGVVGVGRVGVGVAVIVQNEKYEFLLGLRRGTHCPGTWSLPGGKIEFGETPKHAAGRELEEETGLTLQDCHIRANLATPHTNTFFDNGSQWVTLFYRLDPYIDTALQQPRVMEPAKCQEWRWFSRYELPSPLFPPLAANVDRLFI